MSTDHAQVCVGLIVRNPFDNYKCGDRIENPDLVQRILNSGSAQHVIKLLVPAHFVPDVIKEPEKTEIKITKPAPLKTSKKTKE